MAKSFVHVDDTERRLVAKMRESGLTWEKIREITGRGMGTLSKLLVVKKKGGAASKKSNPKGAPKKITPAVYAKLDKAVSYLQKCAGARKEVTVAMIKARAGVDASDRTCLNAFHEHGVYFRKLKERPVLTKADVRARLAWAKKRIARSKNGWVKRPHAIIDNKHFQLYTTGDGREHAARRSVRGAYQVKGGAPKNWLVRPKSTMKFPARGVTVTAAVIKGRIRMWEYVEGNWNGQSAAEMYAGPLVKCMAKAYPEHNAKARAKWEVLEDNDPAGYKSGKALRAKSEAGIATDDLPRRSPDFNVLDYSLWRAINVRMREQESAFDGGKKESVVEYKQRLRRTALSLPTSVVTRAVADMKRRVAMAIEAKGDLFNE